MNAQRSSLASAATSDHTLRPPPPPHLASAARSDRSATPSAPHLRHTIASLPARVVANALRSPLDRARCTHLAATFGLDPPAAGASKVGEPEIQIYASDVHFESETPLTVGGGGASGRPQRNAPSSYLSPPPPLSPTPPTGPCDPDRPRPTPAPRQQPAPHHTTAAATHTCRPRRRHTHTSPPPSRLPHPPHPPHLRAVGCMALFGGASFVPR